MRLQARVLPYVRITLMELPIEAEQIALILMAYLPYDLVQR
jgi:hypothetical protein